MQKQGDYLMVDNSVTVIGRAVQDPEFEVIKGKESDINENKIAKFSVAVAKSRKKDSDVSFFNVIAWNKQADLVMSMVKKGRKMAIQGRLNQSRWLNGEEKRSRIEIIMDNFLMTDPKPKDNDTEDENIVDIGDCPY